MNLTFNPFSLAAKDGATYSFVGSRPDAIRSFTFTERQQELLALLFDGFVDLQRLREGFGDETVQWMLSNGCFVSELPDTESMDSRTHAFYRHNGMTGAEEALRSKSVLILGCGGIGTHMAWHMTLLGVGRLTLVDFDAVEESNLNRQLLFDRGDIGKSKVEVLREKLLRIRPEANIQTIKCRISSQSELEALCTSDTFDLLIKSLDSPAAFPRWLDAVCKKHRLTYTAGITLRDRALIGPTFLPGQSEVGWSDLIPGQEAAEKIHGIAPSFGPMLYHIADALAIESFKILTGAGTLQYPGKIVSENIFTNEREEIRGASTTTTQIVDTRKTTAALLLAFGLLCVAMLIRPVFFPLVLLYAILAPVLISGDQSTAVRRTLLAILIAGGLFLMRLAHTAIQGDAAQVVLRMLLAFCGVSVMSLAGCAFAAARTRKGG